VHSSLRFDKSQKNNKNWELGGNMGSIKLPFAQRNDLNDYNHIPFLLPLYKSQSTPPFLLSFDDKNRSSLRTSVSALPNGGQNKNTNKHAWK
jgi:hypothetical protein